ncbi:MAG: SPOR domain-containing protein [Treponema sp.]|nr:SPOR domain-containing protein [Treponema sp.]
MKKGLTLIIITGILFFLTASSPWEGAAAVAPAGELPESGFFVATNSFPRNTVVDITNIETGRTARVIVANSLSSSGLLATVSREAAEIIGMRSGSVSRVRMVQPSDPLAYLRFTERLASGAPFIDPSMTEERMLEELYSADSYVPPVAALAVTPASPPSSLGPISELTSDRGYVLDEPEWGGSGRLNIVEVPGFIVDPVRPFTDTASPGVAEPPFIIQSEPEPQTAQTAELPSEPAAEPAAVTSALEPVQAEDPVYVSRMEYSEPAAQTLNETPPAEIPGAQQAAAEPSIGVAEAARPAAVNEPIAETETVQAQTASVDNDRVTEITKEVSERIEEVPPSLIIKEVTEFARENPPVEINKQIPDFIAFDDTKDDIEKEVSHFITEVPRDDNVKETSEFITETHRDDITKETNEWIDPVFIATEPEPEPETRQPEIARTAPETLPETLTETPPQNERVALVPVESTLRAPQSVYDIPLANIIPGITVPRQAETPAPAPVQPSYTTAAQPAAVEQSFTSRAISQLDCGKYYVQLASLNAEMVDSTVRRIDPRYNPVVFRDRDNLYRVLIGPLNQGESAAILQRFKSIGYADAFVRYAN